MTPRTGARPLEGFSQVNREGKPQVAGGGSADQPRWHLQDLGRQSGTEGVPRAPSDPYLPPPGRVLPRPVEGFTEPANVATTCWNDSSGIVRRIRKCPE